MNGWTIQIRDSDVPSEIREAAIADGREPVELFKERVEAVSEWVPTVDDGDTTAALAYCVNEVVRTADAVESGETTADSSDLERVDNGGFDLREQTKMDD